MTEYTDTNPKDKLGALKESYYDLPLAALAPIADVASFGARKYGRHNWREKRIRATRYYDAIMRHMQAWALGEDYDQESSCLHLAHAACSLMILLDASHHASFVDDRTKTSTKGYSE